MQNKATSSPYDPKAVKRYHRFVMRTGDRIKRGAQQFQAAYAESVKTGKPPDFSRAQRIFRDCVKAAKEAPCPEFYREVQGYLIQGTESYLKMIQHMIK